MDVPVESEMEEYSSIYDSIFGESKIDRVISNYFELTSSEIIKNEINESKRKEKKISEIKRLSSSIEQELSSIKFLEENHSYKFVGKTNKSNLIFESKNGKRKITPEGLIL
jgi:hypothetical protein